MRTTMFVTLALLVLVFFSNGKCSKEGLKMDNSNEDTKTAVLDTIAKVVKNETKEMQDNTTGVKTAIHEAVRLNRLEIVKFFIEEKGYDVNLRDHDGCTLLFYAIHGSHDVNSKLQMMEYLIEKGADLKAKAKTGATVLHIAARYGDVKIAEFLLEKGAKLNARDNEGLTPLDYAEGNTVHVDPNDNTEGVKTAVHVAVENNQLEVVKFFIEEAGYDVNLRDHDGCTLLFYAVTSPHDVESKLQMMKYLIEKGADVNAAAQTGISVLHLAALYSDTKILKFLLENGADLNAKDSEGLTPFDYAVRKEDDTIHRKISAVMDKTKKMESDGDTNAGNNEGFETLDNVENRGRRDTLKHVEL